MLLACHRHWSLKGWGWSSNDRDSSTVDSSVLGWPGSRWWVKDYCCYQAVWVKGAECAHSCPRGSSQPCVHAQPCMCEQPCMQGYGVTACLFLLECYKLSHLHVVHHVVCHSILTVRCCQVTLLGRAGQAVTLCMPKHAGPQQWHCYQPLRL
jgi:hypothetical protein